MAAQAVARYHPQAWRGWYDAGERKHRSAGVFMGNVSAFWCYWRGWRAAGRNRDAVGRLSCLRGMWMACDTVAFGLIGLTYSPGRRWFLPASLILVSELPSDDRDYWTGLIRLLELRARFRRNDTSGAERIAESLIGLRNGSPHLRGHGFRFLARVRAMQGRHDEALACLRDAIEEFTYMEAHTEIRDVRRAAVCCAVGRDDVRAAKDELRNAGVGPIHPRERIRNRLLAVSICLSERNKPFARGVARLLCSRV